MTLLPPLTSKCAPPSPNHLPPPQSSRFHGDCTALVPRKGHKFTQSYAFLFTSDPWSVSVYVWFKNPNQFQKSQIKIPLEVLLILNDTRYLDTLDASGIDDCTLFLGQLF